MALQLAGQVEQQVGSYIKQLVGEEGHRTRVWNMFCYVDYWQCQVFDSFWYGVFIFCSNSAEHLYLSSCLLPISMVLYVFFLNKIWPIFSKYISVLDPNNFDQKRSRCEKSPSTLQSTIYSSNSGDGMLHWRLVNEMDAIDGLIQARWHWNVDHLQDGHHTSISLLIEVMGIVGVVGEANSSTSAECLEVWHVDKQCKT